MSEYSRIIDVLRMHCRGRFGKQTAFIQPLAGMDELSNEHGYYSDSQPLSDGSSLW